MGDIKDFGKDKVRDYPVEHEISERLKTLIHEYDGQVSLVSVLGILEVIKSELVEQHRRLL